MAEQCQTEFIPQEEVTIGKGPGAFRLFFLLRQTELKGTGHNMRFKEIRQL